MPDRPEFPGQHWDEQVIFKLRRHWWILVAQVVPPLLLFLVAAGIGVIIGLVLMLPMPVWAGLIILLCIGPLGLAIWRFLDWENDHSILTTQRVLYIKRIYFLFESRREASLNKIQDVTVEMPTLMANLLYFGNVEIETAGPTGEITFESVSKPRKVQRLIFRQAGLPEPGTEPSEEWRSTRPRILRPGETFVRMLYADHPKGDKVMIWRKHWFVLLTKIARPVLVTSLFFIAWLAILVANLPPSLEPILQVAVKAIPGIPFVLLVGWVVWVFIDWHNDVYILTETHVIDIEKHPFTLEKRREANLDMIQNVSYVQPSFLAKLLDFGNTQLETAGSMGEFTFDSIPKPREVQEVIGQYLARLREGRPKLEPIPKTLPELEKFLDERYVLTRRGPEKPGLTHGPEA